MPNIVGVCPVLGLHCGHLAFGQEPAAPKTAPISDFILVTSGPALRPSGIGSVGRISMRWESPWILN